MTRARIAVCVFAVLGLIGAAVLWQLKWRVGDVTGDVIVRDTGRFWSYPRYTIEFPEIDASRAGVHEFHVAGLPSFPLTFSLVLTDSVPSKNYRLTVQIRDRAGDVALKASDLASDWKWQRGGNHSALWHPTLRDIQFRRNEKYTIEIAIEAVADVTDSRLLVPQLKGGGNELP